MKIKRIISINLIAMGGIALEIMLALLSVGEKSFDTCVWIASIQTGLAVIVAAEAGYGLVSVPVFFILLSFLFHCSQFLFTALGMEYEVAFDVVKTAGKQLSIATIQFYTFSILFLSIGFLINIRPDIHFVKRRKINNTDCARIGIILMLLCAAPRLYLDFQHLFAYLTRGYEATYTNDSGLMLVWAYGFYLGFLFYIIGKRKHNEKILIPLIIFVSSTLLMMASGRRLEQAGVLATIVILYIRYCKKKRVKAFKLFLIAVLGYIALAIIATMGDMRYSLDVSLNAYMEMLQRNLAGGLLTGQLAEFGDTGLSLAMSIKCFPQYHSFNYGRSYLVSWIQVLPNVGGAIRNAFEADLNFTAAIPEVYWSNYGCSYLGELYFNFGWLGAFFNLFIGMAIGKMSKAIEGSMRLGLIDTRIMMYIGILPTLFTYIRGSFGDFVRIWVYYSILLSVVSMTIRHRETQDEPDAA